MTMMEVQLPGGLYDNGRIERHVVFRPITGRIEQVLIEASNAGDSDRSQRVTAILGAVLQRIGDTPVDATLAARLSIADRQFLMLRLAALLEGEGLWLKVTCSQCSEPFDVELRRCDLPVTQAGEGYPEAEVSIGGHRVKLRVPQGRDQEGLDGVSEEQAMQRLLERCLLSVDGAQPGADFVAGLNEQAVQAIDAALDTCSPSVCDRLSVSCPECGHAQTARLDHYSGMGSEEYFFYSEIHILASHYHWSEADILDLTQAKRRRYLDLISRSPAPDAAGVAR